MAAHLDELWDFEDPAGNRIGLILQGSNTVWAVPGNPGQVDVAQGRLGPRIAGSRLFLPTIGRSAVFE